MTNSIASTKNYTAILDEVYQRASVSGCLNSGRRLVRAGRNAKEIMIPKISVTGLGDYTRNVGYKTGSINYEFETKTFKYDRGIRLMADVMDVEEAGVLDCFVEAGAELQRTQVAPEADAFTFAQIASHAGVASADEDLSSASAADLLEDLRVVTSTMDTDNDIAPCRALKNQIFKTLREWHPAPTMTQRMDCRQTAGPSLDLSRRRRVPEAMRVTS